MVEGEGEGEGRAEDNITNASRHDQVKNREGLTVGHQRRNVNIR